MSDYLGKQSPPYQNLLTTTPSDLEATGFPSPSISLAPSQRTVPDSRTGLSYTSVKRHVQTTVKCCPYDLDHHSKSKVAVARVHSSSNKKSPGPIARLGGDSLKYVQELTVRAGVHSPLQTPLTDSLQIGSGYSTHVTLHPSSPIGSTTTPPVHQALSLPSSFAFAARIPENQLSSAPASLPLLPVSLQSAADSPGSSQQDERNRLAELLRDYLQTNPETIIGDPDNPFPSADPLGIRGLSIFSAFFEHADMETFTCTFCGDIKTDMGAALDHQRTFLQYCVE